MQSWKRHRYQVDMIWRLSSSEQLRTRKHWYLYREVYQRESRSTAMIYYAQTVSPKHFLTFRLFNSILKILWWTLAHCFDRCDVRCSKEIPIHGVRWLVQSFKRTSYYSNKGREQLWLWHIFAQFIYLILPAEIASKAILHNKAASTEYDLTSIDADLTQYRQCLSLALKDEDNVSNVNYRSWFPVWWLEQT